MAWRTFRALLGARAASARNALWRGSMVRRVFWLAVLMVGAVFWYGVFSGSRWAVSGVVELTSSGHALALTAFEASLLMLLAAVAFSSLLFSLAEVYLAPDTKFIAAVPASTTTLLAVKSVEIGLMAAAMPLIFGSPVLVGLGAALNASAAYYGVAVICLLLFVLIPTTVGLATATVMVNVFPATRARDILVFLALVVLLGGALLIRLLQPERLADASALTELSDRLVSMRLPGSRWLPSGWVASALRPMLHGETSPSWIHVGFLAVTAAASALVATVTFRALFFRGLSRALASRARVLGGDGVGARAVRIAARLLPRRIGAMAVKDLLTFGRDTSQWSQLLLLGGMAIVYVITLQSFPVADLGVVGLTPEAGADLLAFANLGPAGFVLAAVASRFQFTAVSLEGRAFWIGFSSPIGVRTIMAAKLAVGLPLLWLYALPLTVGVWLVLGASVPVGIMTFAGTTFCCTGICCLGVGMGAATPRFDVENPGRLVVSLAGVAFMFTALSFVVGVWGLLAYPAYLAHQSTQGVPIDGGQWGLAALLGFLALALTVVASTAPLLIGGARLQRYERGA